MHICHLAIVHDVLCDARILRKMAKSSVDAGDKVEIITAGVRSQEKFGVQIIGLHEEALNRKKLPLVLFQAYREALKRKANIYHIHEVPLMLVGVLLRFLHGKTVVADIHEDFAAEVMGKGYLPRSLRYLIRTGYRVFESIFIRRFDHIVLAEDSYEANFSSVKNRTVVRNFPVGSAVQFEPMSSQAPTVWKVCYVGTVSEDRGALDLIEALGILRNSSEKKYSGVFVGPIHSEELRNRMLERASECGLDDSQFVLLGKKTHEYVAANLTNFHVGFSALHDDPNYTGSMPTKILEYNLAGLPSIVSDFPISHRFVKPEVNGIIVKPGNPTEIADAIVNLTRDWAHYSKLRQSSRDYVMVRYEWDGEFSKLNRVYRTLLREQREQE